MSIEDDIKLLERAALLLRTDQNNIINDLPREGWTLEVSWMEELGQYRVILIKGSERYGGASESSVQGALARAVLRMPIL